MLKLLKRYKNAIYDFFYSFVAYVLPTAVLQFAVYPLVARWLGPEENGLFLTLLNVVRLCVTVLVIPLTNMRLVEKKRCSENVDCERNYNFLFISVVAIAMLATGIFQLVYSGANGDIWAYVRLLTVLVLLCAHDFYAIAFRVVINYKLLLIDNLLIIVGYALGTVLFWLFGYWELIFICGYVLGLGFVLIKSTYWRKGIKSAGAKRILPEYSQLCTSTCLNSATVYCDKMLIYPMLGGYAVSVYNAAAVASKVMTLISAPVCNVLLSHIVNVDHFKVSKKMIRRAAVGVLVAGAVVYGCFYLASVVLCRLLYPQFFAEALKYMPIILMAIFLETCSGVLKIVLLRFKQTKKLLTISSTKVSTYLISVLLSNILSMGLKGFCTAVLLADIVQFSLVVFLFFKTFSVGRPHDKENQSET